MDNLMTFLAFSLIAAALAFIAFPHLFIPQERAKKKLVGSSYWGVYEGQAVEEPEALKTIEVKEPARKERVIGGSAMYAAGRGTSFRQ